MKKFVFLLTTTVFLTFILATLSFGQVPFTTVNTAVTQNFNGLTTADFLLTDNTSIPGVYAFRTAGNATPNIFVANAGTGTTGSFYNYGTAAAADRALGSLASSGTGTLFYGVRFVNNTGVTITSLRVTYTGEQWRKGGALVPQILSFDYRQATTVTDLTTGVYTDVTTLDFATPTNTAGGSALDGNAAANRTTITQTFAVTIPVGQEIMLRWTDLDDTGTDSGVAIDDLSVVPNPLVLAAGVIIGGRVRTESGIGLNNAEVTLTDQTGATRTVQTSSFGYFLFDDLEAGGTYILNVTSKQRQFTPQVVTASDGVTNIEFIAPE